MGCGAVKVPHSRLGGLRGFTLMQCSLPVVRWIWHGAWWRRGGRCGRRPNGARSRRRRRNGGRTGTGSSARRAWFDASSRRRHSPRSACSAPWQCCDGSWHVHNCPLSDRERVAVTRTIARSPASEGIGTAWQHWEWLPICRRSSRDIPVTDIYPMKPATPAVPPAGAPTVATSRPPNANPKD